MDGELQSGAAAGGEFSLPVEVSLLEEQEKISTPVIVLRFTTMQEDNGDTEEER